MKMPNFEVSALKIPNQFPWIVGLVVLVHGVLAIVMFSGSGDSLPESTAAMKPTVPSVGTAAEPSSHPLVSRTGAESGDASAAAVAAAPKDENGEYRSRFPKRVPLQSELGVDEPAVESSARDSEAIADDTPARVKETGRISNPGAFSLADLPSAVAAAKAAPIAERVEEAKAVTEADAKRAATRLRMVEAKAPRPVPVSQPKLPQPEAKPKVEPIEKIEKTSKPAIKRITPERVIAAPVKQIRAVPIAHRVEADPDEETAAAPRPGPEKSVEPIDPITPDGSRRFRVIRPIER